MILSYVSFHLLGNFLKFNDIFVDIVLARRTYRMKIWRDSRLIQNAVL